MDQQDAATSTVAPYAISSGGREVLKWIALLLMTGDHVAKVVFGGYLPVATELGRVAFPLFALVMACNLAQPGTDLGKSIRRLLLWGAVAQPLHMLAFDHALPVNILLTFVVAALVVLSLAKARPWLMILAGGVLPALVDYQWVGVALVVLGWIAFRNRVWWLPLPALAVMCWHNGNGWALLAVPLVLVLARVPWRVPRWRWSFYVYYVAHLAVLAGYVAWVGE